MVATVMAALVGWLMFSSHAFARRWLTRPTWGYIELAPGNIPVPIMPWELPVAHAIRLPPFRLRLQPSSESILLGKWAKIVSAPLPCLHHVNGISDGRRSHCLVCNSARS